METLLVPHNLVQNLNGNFTTTRRPNQTLIEMEHNGHISKMFTALTMWYYSIGYCVTLDHNKFSVLSKPWQCQIQVELFMPDKVFQFEKYTHVFSYAESKQFHFKPSSIPPVNIFIDFRTVHDYDHVSLISWLFRRNVVFVFNDSLYFAITDITLRFQVDCKTVASNKLTLTVNC